jgi:hypothetical protein
MSVTEQDIREIQSNVAPLLGKKAWGVALGVGSFVTLEFGEPRPLATGEGQRGEWHLWVYCCAWRLETESEVLAGSEDPREHLAEAVRRLEGLVLERIEVLAPSLESTLTFEGGMRLRLFPLIFAGEYEHWLLYTPEGDVLSIGPGTSWSLEKSS